MTMNLSFEAGLADKYSSPSQKVRVLTERWVSTQVYCPNCGHLDIDKYPNNKPVADFFCSNCKEDYELKSKNGVAGKKIVDGAYRTMMAKLQESSVPNFFLLNYDLQSLEVQNFLVIPKHFFVPSMIEKRRPLAKSAQRAGWIGCNILLQSIPNAGKVYFIRNCKEEPKANVLNIWQKTLFLKEETKITARGWLLDVMQCVERTGKRDFVLDDIYAFETDLKNSHPENNHIRDKIRQQLQVLRDKGYLTFEGNGMYKLS